MSGGMERSLRVVLSAASRVGPGVSPSAPTSRSLPGYSKPVGRLTVMNEILGQTRAYPDRAGARGLENTPPTYSIPGHTIG